MPTSRQPRKRPRAQALRGSSRQNARHQGARVGNTVPRSVASGPAARPSSAAASSRPTARGRQSTGVLRVPTSNGELLITRRHFLYGALGIGALAAVTAGATAISTAKKRDEAVATLTVSSDSVSTLDDYSEVSPDSAFTLVNSFELPFGTLVWANGTSVAACLLPTDQASPLTQIGLLHLSSGSCDTVVDKAVGASDGFEIYDARASTNGIVWTEANIMEGQWRVYAAGFGSGTTLNTPRVIDSGSNDQETPALAAVGDWAFWQTMPAAGSTQAKTGAAAVKRAKFSGGDSESVYESKGRMATPLYAGENGVVATPRSAKSSSYYDLVHIDGTSGQQDDTTTLPSGMKPNQVGYGPNGFSFCFESIYSYGDGIANLGTYTPVTAHAPGSGYDGLSWFRFGKTPYGSPCWCTKEWFMVKSTRSVCAINPSSRTYCTLNVASGCTDWGDYLASSGTNSNVVTAMQINQTDTSGQTVKKTQVRVWSPAST